MAKRSAPAAERNRAPILAVLSRVLPTSGLMLEIGSGTGQHAVHFAGNLPGLTWQPSDIDDEALESIAAWRAEAGLDNLLPPMRLDVTRHPWPLRAAEAVFSANMIHIAPWQACEGLVRGAGQVLPPRGLMVLYGPFKLDGRHVSASNAEFDRALRARNPEWGVRDLAEVEAVAASHRLGLREVVEMPANNRIVIFEKES